MITKEKKTKYDKKYYLKNRDKVIAQSKTYYLNNKAKVIKRSAEWKKKNLQKFLESNKKWKKKNPDKLLTYKLKSKFGLTLEDYRVMWANQNNSCAICWKPGARHIKTLHIDHNHKTGKVRGLLCNECNLGLGLFKDDIYRLQNAIYYLKKKI